MELEYGREWGETGVLASRELERWTPIGAARVSPRADESFGSESSEFSERRMSCSAASETLSRSTSCRSGRLLGAALSHTVRVARVRSTEIRSRSPSKSMSRLSPAAFGSTVLARRDQVVKLEQRSRSCPPLATHAASSSATLNRRLAMDRFVMTGGVLVLRDLMEKALFA